MNHSELKKIITICKKNGIKRVKTNEIELEFGEIVHIHKHTGPIVKETNVLTDPEMKPTEDEMLFWSSETIDHGAVKQ